MDTTNRPAWSPEEPYDQLPALPPPLDIENRAVLKQCVRARTTLAQLKVAANLIPNPAVLINTLPLLEAQASSEIENIVTTADSLFSSIDIDDNADPATREAHRYRKALLEGGTNLKTRPLNTRTAELICSQIKGVHMTVRRLPGTQLKNAVTGAVIYTPPEGETHIRQLLKNWEDFLHANPEQSPFDPLVRMAILHYQFEAIHPFTDGNGRTGRVLNSLFLVEHDLLSQPILYLSRYIIAHKSDYYRLLLNVTKHGAWEEWLLFMLLGIEETAQWTIEKINAIQSLNRTLSEHLRLHHIKLYNRDAIDVIFEQPYCRIANLVERGHVTRQAASRYLHALVHAGILQEKRVGREKIFVHPKLLKLLTEDGNDFSPYRPAL